MKRRSWLVLLLAPLMVAAYVGASALAGDPGFPLDDGWIHQTYARNLGLNGRWEYVPGVVSAGSTSPLWTVILALGYLLRLPYLWWTFAWGALSLTLLAWAAMRLWSLLWPARADQAWQAGVVVVLSWPLVWAAASGMETAIFAALGLLLAGEYAAAVNAAPITYAQALRLGMLGGLLILTRPDGLILLALVTAGLLLARQMRALVVGGVTVVVLLLPYFALNYFSSGTFWPNTLYAKQTEYTVLLAQPLVERMAQLLYFSLGGPAEGWQGSSAAHLLLLPGLVVAGWQAARSDWQRRRLLATLPLLWAGGHVFAYAWRLPVTYQHGRYLLPALPLWLVYGLAGWHWLLQRRVGRERWLRPLRQVAVISFALLLFVYLGLGGQAYAQDVAFINGEMVTVAHWLVDNTPPETLIAAHDIGAIGYFAQRPLLDLAGLISPEVIPLLDDEAAMADYLLQSEADYLVTAPGWPYTAVVEETAVEQLYSTEYPWTQLQGLNNMTVYSLPGP